MRLVRFTLGYPYSPEENRQAAINPAMVTEVYPVSETECLIALSNHQTPDYWVRVRGSFDEVVAISDSASAQASDAIIARIKEERRLQDRKWGGPTYDDKHSLGDWAHFIDQRTETLYRAPERKVAEQELIEVAALAIAALESLRRNREGK